MDPFLDQLAALCREQPTAPKWVIVPSHALGHTLGDRLALGGTSWVNLRFKTPFDLALEAAAPTLVDRGVDPIAEDVGPTLVMRLLLDLPPDTPAYFRALDSEILQEKMAAALWSTLSELRMSGLGAGALLAWAFDNPDKRAELVALVEAYERYLADRQLADTAAVFTEALALVDDCPIGGDDPRLTLPDVLWPLLTRRFLDALPGHEVGEAAVRRPPGLTVPGRLTGLALERPAGTRTGGTSGDGPDAAGGTDAASLWFLMTPEAAPPPKDDGTLAMFRAGGKEAEVEEVFRRIAASRVRLDDVEIVCAASDYPFLIWQKAVRHDWPVTLSAGVPVTATRPARAIAALFDWIERDYPASRLRRLFQSGDVTLRRDDGLTSGRAARLLTRSEAAWGRSTYDAALRGLAAADRERAADPEVDEEAQGRARDRAAEVDGLRIWIEHLLTLIPESGEDGTVAFDALLRGVARFAADYARRSDPLDNQSASAIGDALEELKLLGELRRPMGEALRLIRSALEGLTAGADRARPGHLHVTSIARAGQAGRAHTFVVGLEEGRVFPAPVEDAVLLDGEREAIGGGLPTSGDHATEAVFGVVSRLAAIGAATDDDGTTTLSYSCRDLRQYRDTFPSWLLLQAFRLGRSGETTYGDLIAKLAEPVSAVPSLPDAAVSDSGWWLANLHVGGLPEAPLLEAFPGLRRGLKAEQARESDLFTVYDGAVPEAGRLLDPRGSRRVMSATRLEGLAECPFRHFLQYGLGVDALEEAEPERDVWLNPLTRGSELHALYADVMRRVRDEGRSADPSHDLEWLTARADDRLRRLTEIMPPPSALVFDRERQQLIEDLALFLTLEAEQPDRRPVALEVGFGRPARGLLTDEADAVEPLARADAVRIGDERSGFLLRGKIDRIDEVDGRYEVVDYKTGSFFEKKYGGTFHEGRLLQHALYGLAAVELLRPVDPDAQVSAGSYYFPSIRGGGQTSSKPHPPAAATLGVLGNLFDTVANGAFVHTADGENCRFCKHSDACGRDRFARAGRKIWNTANTALEPYRKLLRTE
ncbi:MAG: PD-(D/E)XK nuclease family protein [Vicinamibacterales bacterium]|jgi:ATP-dependent helicase/nuclease subunit B|nr:hypothetical protein [Acidobacteriota bacterium]MDP7295093.1 PD-(D/E)XK nuclease family protein [Vicinamibacterales bacterium]MDP7470773.1 PD-(D/E)XK nuclease family protein [Vicinamibacterales bacterium]MDP7671806.1 PD-(D/E)XK nuclease family protein [Vicinamibacterales bacterium]HJO38339.1 PD-(D/E)XK nuclease family protein [Vicinamibacterales bacterium]